jgi:hypothetical protein
MATVQAWMIDPQLDHVDHGHPNESGCDDTLRCVGCGGKMHRELISEPFENDAQVYCVWWFGYRCGACGKVNQPIQDPRTLKVSHGGNDWLSR